MSSIELHLIPTFYLRGTKLHKNYIKFKIKISKKDKSKHMSTKAES
jgi:hypothetical protein